MKIFQKLQTLLEQKVTSNNHNESVLKPSAIWAQSITWGLIATTSFSIVWLAFAKTEEIVVAEGTLVPVGSVRDIQMPIGGIVDEILVKDGDRVEPDQVLIKLDTESSSERLKSTNKNLRLSLRHLELKKIELNHFKSLNEQSLNTLSNKLLFEKKIQERFRALSEVGASAELQYLQQRNRVQEVEGQLRETRLDGLRKQAILAQDIQRIKSDTNKLRLELMDIKTTLRYQVLRSPIAGLVFDIQPKGQGFTGKQSETLMKIVPLNALEANIKILSSDIGFVRKGMNVGISIDSFPATEFGILNGQLQQLGSDALPPDASKQEVGYRYPATVEIEDQFLKLKNGTKLPLQPGMSLLANIKLRKVTYLQLLLGAFSEKAESLKQL